MEIKIKKINENAIIPEKIEVGDWIDLCANEKVHMRKGELKYIPLGLAMELPNGYEAIVAPRSSTPKNFGIVCANSFGVIDNSYCGDGDEWKFPAYAINNTIINVGDRICQFRIQKNQPKITFKVVETLKNENRGGIGSTGMREV